MRKESTVNQGLDEKLICRSLEFFATQKIGMTGEKCIRKRGITVLNGMTLFVCCLLSNVAHAECVPTPDCASIGYTETSCSGDSLKCPFDTSKLFCVPCDSSYKYNCSGDNITGGVGSSCGGKYVSCSCLGGRTFNNGSCPQSCTVGMIYYSDKSCSSTYDSSKTAIGVVVKDNELVLSQKSSDYMYWSNVHVDTSLDDLDEDPAKEDFNGKTNTITIIAEDSDNVAAVYCNDYRTSGTNAGDWYLPAFGELYSYVYGNYSVINTSMTSIGWNWDGDYLWSSSEGSIYVAWSVKIDNGNIVFDDKIFDTSVSCFLPIN